MHGVHIANIPACALMNKSLFLFRHSSVLNFDSKNMCVDVMMCLPPEKQ